MWCPGKPLGAGAGKPTRWIAIHESATGKAETWFGGFVLAWRLCQPIVDREQRQLQPAGDPYFVEDIGQMMLDRVLAQREAAGDFLVAQAGYDGGQDVHLALGKPVVARRLFARGISAQELD